MEDEPTPQKTTKQENETVEESPQPEGVAAHLPRLFRAFEQARASGKSASTWLVDGLSLLGALHKLGRTLTQLANHARRAAAQNRAQENAVAQPLLDADIINDIREQFQDLIDQFPDAGELFFGVDKLDDFIAELFVGSTDISLLGAFGDLGDFLDAKLSGFVERLIDWAFDQEESGLHAKNPKFKRIEEFIHGLENLMQEVLDRWVLPGIYDLDGDEDDAS